MKTRYILVLFGLTLTTQVLSLGATTTPFVKILIKNISNMTDYRMNIAGTSVPAEETIRLSRPLAIPFISIADYLKEYSTNSMYTPKKALEININKIKYHLWASESGVMVAPDPDVTDHDEWHTEKILGITPQEHRGKSLYVATLVLKALKNKINVNLEPAVS